MLEILGNRSFRHLFAAQIVALLGTGLATVALGLLAYDLSGGNAGMVLGTVFALKMVAYVAIAPIAGAFANQVPRRTMLVVLDCVRAAVACLLPFVAAPWQIFTLIFIMQAASAAFTPTFQATLPDILPDEKDYTRGLSLSRFVYDLENLISPSLAAFVLIFASYHALFYGTALGFIGSGLLIVSVALPKPEADEKRRSIYERTTRGIRIYLATPRLRGLLALCLVVAACGSMVLVNTVVLVQSVLGLDAVHVAYTLGAYGAGSMLTALTLPRLLDHFQDRTVMLAGSVLMILPLLALVGLDISGAFVWPLLLVAWFVVGSGYSAILTPSGRLLQRSSHQPDRPALYAAQFALSHACWLICYPLSGYLQTVFGMQIALGSLSLLGIAALGLAVWQWPTAGRRDLYHVHSDLPEDHPHLKESPHDDGQGHSHVYIIDDTHSSWPRH